MNDYGKQEYTFYIQSAEDFYAQLREFERNNYLEELDIDTEDCTLAQDMLKGIGVNIK